MFDVIRLAHANRDWYQPLCDTFGCTGYFKIEVQADPTAPTTLSQHVGGRLVQGREVLTALRQWSPKIYRDFAARLGVAEN